MTLGHSVLSIRTVRKMRTNRNGPYAWLIDTDRINFSLYKLYKP